MAIDGNKWKQQQIFFSWAPKSLQMMTVTMKLKRLLLLGRKAMTNIGIILKNRDITQLTKVPIVKAMVFPVVMHRCDSWTIKKAEHRKIDALELWYRKTLLRISWTARRFNQSVLKKIYPEYSLKWLMLKLKLQYSNALATWCEEQRMKDR